MTFSARIVDVVTAGGVIRGQRVVIATGRPTPLFKALVRHFWFRSTYFALTESIPAKIRRALGAASRSCATRPIRRITSDGWTTIGCSWPAPTDRRSSDRLREKTIVQRTGQLMYELSTLYPDISGIAPAYGWDAGYARTGDGLPYIGPHRNFPRHLFAFGDAQPRRDRRVSREPHPAAPPPGRSRGRRRGVRVHHESPLMNLDLLVFGPASRRPRNRPGRHDRAACALGPVTSACAT